MKTLRAPLATRFLLLLAGIALFMHFVSSAGLLRSTKDPFDFSSALCITAPAPINASAIAGESFPAEPSHDGPGCCDLCCSAAVPVAISLSSGFTPPDAGSVPPTCRLSALISAARWAPHAARAPPQVS